MKRLYPIILAIALLGCTNNYKSASNYIKELGTMPPFEQGFEMGVSACYAAVYRDTLYIAGGCNFPDTPASQGGSKRFYQGIYKAAIGDTLIWHKAGVLPEPSAYGASLIVGEKLIIAGGTNSKGASSAVYSIDLSDDCKVDTLPSLPYTVDNATATIANNFIYVIGGNINGEPSNIVFALNLSDGTNEWSQLPTPPSRARVQPVCAANEKALYIWGGFSPADSIGRAITHSDGIRYLFAENRWEQLTDVTLKENSDRAISLSGGTALLFDKNTIIAAGGVDKEIFTDAISGTYSLTSKEEYMHHPAEWYRFNPHLIEYNIDENSWKLLKSDRTFARAGAIMIAYKNNIIYIGGELKPGIRTPQINMYRP